MTGNVEKQVPEELQAAGQVFEIVMVHYTGQRGLHAETVIGALSALVGEWALRAGGQPLPESGWVVGGAANHFLLEADDSAWAAMKAVLIEQNVITQASLPDPVEIVARTAASVGSSPFPPLTVPEDHYPHEWSPVACPRFRGAITELADKRGFSARQMLTTLALAVGLFIVMAKDALSPLIGVRLALEIMIGVSRMAPLQAESQAGDPS